MQEQLSVSLVIPMFNEEENIEHAIGCATAALERSTLSSPSVILKIFRELVTLYPEMRRPQQKGRKDRQEPASEPAEAPFH